MSLQQWLLYKCISQIVCWLKEYRVMWRSTGDYTGNLLWRIQYGGEMPVVSIVGLASACLHRTRTKRIMKSRCGSKPGRLRARSAHPVSLGSVPEDWQTP